MAFCKEYATDVSARLAANGNENSPRGGFPPAAAPLQHASSSGQLSRTQSLAGLEVAAQQHQVSNPFITSPLERTSNAHVQFLPHTLPLMCTAPLSPPLRCTMHQCNRRSTCSATTCGG